MTPGVMLVNTLMFYGPGGPYALFTGKDASRALAKMSFEEKDLTGDISGLGPFELEALQDWEYKFMSKYVKVGTVKKTLPVSDGLVSDSADPAHDTTAAKAAEDGGPSESTAENDHVREPSKEPSEEPAKEPVVEDVTKE
ncbi:Membrane steroid-binding protein 1 [Asimina triloba]